MLPLKEAAGAGVRCLCRFVKLSVSRRCPPLLSGRWSRDCVVCVARVACVTVVRAASWRTAMPCSRDILAGRRGRGRMRACALPLLLPLGLAPLCAWCWPAMRACIRGGELTTLASTQRGMCGGRARGGVCGRAPSAVSWEGGESTLFRATLFPRCNRSHTAQMRECVNVWVCLRVHVCECMCASACVGVHACVWSACVWNE